MRLLGGHMVSPELRAGKSAITQTIAEGVCEEINLLASFIFSRNRRSISQQCQPSPPSYQITFNLPHILEAILRAIKCDPLISTKSITVQFKSLIVVPPWQPHVHPPITLHKPVGGETTVKIQMKHYVDFNN